MMQKIFAAIEKLNLYLAVLLGLVLLVMTLTVTREVFGRYVLASPTSWVLTLNQMLLIALTYLGAGYTMMRDGHVRADFIYIRLRPQARLVVDIVTTLFIVLYCTFIVWQGWDLAWDSLTKGISTAEAVDWPLFPSQLLVPIGTFLLGVQAIINLLNTIKKIRRTTK